MDEYYEDGYEIEPFMPGISPVGKGSPGTTGVSVPRPYVPYGTGYDAVRPRPGYGPLKDTLSGMGRIELFADRQFRPGTQNPGSREFGKIVKEPENYFKISPGEYRQNAIKHANHQIRLNHHPGLGWQPPENNDGLTRRESLKQQAPNRNLYTYGWEQGSYMPKEDMIAYKEGDPTAKRHQIMRALQARSGLLQAKGSGYSTMGGVFPIGLSRTADYTVEPPRDIITGNLDGEEAYKNNLKNLEAKIGANKSLRKGFEQWVSRPANEVERLNDFGPPSAPRKTEKLREVAAKAARAIPGKPGMFTGRVPSMQGLGGGMVDMFMEGPALQEAKSNPLAGIGEEERARLEAAYQYGL